MRRSLSNFASAFLIVALASVTPAHAEEGKDAAPPNATKVTLRWGEKIPMRDGIELNATVYRPKAQTAPAPCIFTLTPYISQSYHDRGVYFAANGLPFLTVDVRGRGNSAGEFRPLIQEAKDGHDVVEWLAKQPYCNGKISMWGGSYAGYNQWATAKELPPHLATIVPAAAAHPGVDYPARNNITYPYTVQWLMFVAGNTSQDRMFGDNDFWVARNRERFEAGSAFNTVDELFGMPSKTFQEWLAHPYVDAYWDSFVPTQAQYEQMTLPILTITGAYDGDQPGALAFYRRHMQFAPAAARANHYLIIGPWDHAGTRTPQAEFGGLKVGPASLVDLPKLHLDWYAWTMQGGAKPEFLKKPVAYYVIGSEQWRYADSLDAVTASTQTLYLQGQQNPDDVFTAGLLDARQSRGGQPHSYVYDPRDTKLADLESKLDGNSMVDQTMVLASKGRQLVYHTAPFERATEVSGFFKLSAWLSIDQPDTDFQATVYEIAPDGSSLPLGNDVMRARYRESLRTPKLVQTRAPQRYDFNSFNFVSKQVKAGSRLRLVIGPMNSMHTQKNFNSGKPVSEETMADAKTVTVKLYHDAQHPSTLQIPFGAAVN